MKAISSGCGFTISTPASWPHRLPCMVKIVPNRATRLSLRREFRGQRVDDVDQGHARTRRRLGDADVRRDGGHHRRLRAGAGHALDEGREVARQLVELAGADEALAVVDVGMGDHQIGHDAARFAGSGDLLVVVDRGADTEAADDADAGHAGKLRFHTSASSRQLVGAAGDGEQLRRLGSRTSRAWAASAS